MFMLQDGGSAHDDLFTGLDFIYRNYIMKV